MNKSQVNSFFKTEVLPSIKQQEKQYKKRGQHDLPLRQQEWEYCLEQLKCDGKITQEQLDKWSFPMPKIFE